MNSYYGLATKVRALPGQHESLSALLEEVSRLVLDVPGCLSYTVSSVNSDPEAMFITEFWEDRESQQSAFARAAIYEIAIKFHALSTDIEQHELQPLAN